MNVSLVFGLSIGAVSLSPLRAYALSRCRERPDLFQCVYVYVMNV